MLHDIAINVYIMQQIKVTTAKECTYMHKEYTRNTITMDKDQIKLAHNVFYCDYSKAAIPCRT